MRKLEPDEHCAVVLAVGTNGIGAIRSLRREGVTVIVICPPKDLSSYSRYCHHIITTGDDTDSEKELLDTLIGLSTTKYTSLIPCSDINADFICKYKDTLSSKYSLLCGENSLSSILNDKRSEVEIIRKCQYASIPNSATHLAEKANTKTCPVNLPAIVKPRTTKDYDIINAKNIILKDEHSWKEFLLKYGEHLDRFIVQEIIDGVDEMLWVCNATFDKSSDLICAFTFQRLGTSPSHYGVTSMAISRQNKTIIEAVREIGHSLGHVGPAMIEFKYDKVSKNYMYIETNPRIGMCNWFDTSCGINNVYTTHLCSLGIKPTYHPKQKNNILYINFLFDLISRIEDRESPFLYSNDTCVIFFVKKSTLIHYSLTQDLTSKPISAFRRVSRDGW